METMVVVDVAKRARIPLLNSIQRDFELYSTRSEVLKYE